jgi:hypothetical protein
LNDSINMVVNKRIVKSEIVPRAIGLVV